MTETKELILGNANKNPELPAFAQDDVGVGTEGMAQYVRPPRVQVVQALSKNLTEDFNVGDTVLMPSKSLLAPVSLNDAGRPSKAKVGAGESWFASPIYFFVEWIAWNPREETKLPSIRERSLDPKSDLARRCQNRDTWFDKLEGSEYNVRNCEHINFVVVPISGEFAGTPMALSYSRSEHRTGAALAALVKQRKAAIFANVFEFAVGYRENSSGEWYGVNGFNPSEESETAPFIQDEDIYDHFKNLHNEFAEAHREGLVQIDMESGGGEDEPSETTTDF